MLKGKVKFKELEDGIVALVLKEALRPGDPILPELRLADLFGVSRATVRQALGRLEARGVLRSERGRGTFIVKVPEENKAEPRRSGLVAFVCYGGIDNPFMGKIARGIEEGALEEGMNLCVASSCKGEEREEELIRGLLKKEVDGIVIAPTKSNPPGAFLKSLCASDANVVVASDIPDLNAPTAASDNERGATLAVRALIDAGHRKIAVIRGPARNREAAIRFECWRKTLAAAGLDASCKLAPEPPPEEGYSKELGRAGMKKLLALPAAERPTAVFAANDEVASGAWSFLKESGLSTPGDVSLAGYGNFIATLEDGTGLASVDERPFEIGLAAWELLKRRLAGDAHVRSSRTLIRPELELRGSVARFAGELR